jgi:hypothetical protein
MMCPDNHLTTIPTFTSLTILVSNFFTGEANRPLQLGDMIKMAKNLNIELDITDLMRTFESGARQQVASLLLFQDSHTVTLKLRRPIKVSDHYDPNTNTFPPDWYISDHIDNDHPTKYFIRPIEQPLPPTASMSALLTISGAPQSSVYHTRLRFAALRLIKQALQWKQRQALVACYHNIYRQGLPTETVLVTYLSTTLHTTAQRSELQQQLMAKIGHGTPATLIAPFRNASMDFFEVIISASFDKMLPPVCNLERQQGDAHYYYHSSGIKAAAPYSAIINKFNQSLPTNAIMIGAALIDR